MIRTKLRRNIPRSRARGTRAMVRTNSRTGRRALARLVLQVWEWCNDEGVFTAYDDDSRVQLEARTHCALVSSRAETRSQPQVLPS